MQDTDDRIRLPALRCLELRAHPQRGRGVFTIMDIDKGTLIHISPVLLFDHTEYSEHGKYTQLDHYTYCWRGGYALALGLGSMFNHEPFGHQNVGFVRDMERSLIKYIALRDISAGEELCICYGHDVWFEMVSENEPGCQKKKQSQGEEETETAEGMLGCFDL